MDLQGYKYRFCDVGPVFPRNLYFPSARDQPAPSPRTPLGCDVLGLPFHCIARISMVFWLWEIIGVGEGGR